MHSNINEDSYRTLKIYRQNQIKANIRLHLIFILLLFIIDIGLIIFIIIYKIKLSSLKYKTSQDSNMINSNKDFIDKNQNMITNKYLNIVAQSPQETIRFSLSLDNSQEVNKIKNNIIKFYKENKNINLDINKFSMKFIYQAVMEGDTYTDIKNKINMYSNIFILFEAEEENKFGFFLEEQILLDNKHGFEYNGNNCFIMSFQHEGIFKCIGDKNKLRIKDEDNLLLIGEDDIIIKNKFLFFEEKRSMVNFPFKAFDVSTINQNIFTNNNENIFNTLAMEIFSFDF
jgi:hypothetical protein